MITTNEFGLPERFIRAVENDSYDKGDADYSISQLINPPQVSFLSEKYDDEIEVDVIDQIWKLFGNAVHDYLAKFAGPNELPEQRYFAELADKKITGKPDIIAWLLRNRLEDYKVTSVWNIIYGSRLEEWKLQTNGYVYLLEKHGFKVDDVEIIAILRDWRPSEFHKMKNYPPRQVVKIPIHKMETAEIEDYLTERIELYKRNEGLPDSLLKECSKEEHWSWKRCEKYCPASKFCVQYKNKLKGE